MVYIYIYLFIYSYIETDKTGGHHLVALKK